MPHVSGIIRYLSFCVHEHRVSSRLFRASFTFFQQCSAVFTVQTSHFFGHIYSCSVHLGAVRNGTVLRAHSSCIRAGSQSLILYVRPSRWGLSCPWALFLAVSSAHSCPQSAFPIALQMVSKRRKPQVTKKQPPSHPSKLGKCWLPYPIPVWLWELRPREVQVCRSHKRHQRSSWLYLELAELTKRAVDPIHWDSRWCNFQRQISVQTRKI